MLYYLDAIITKCYRPLKFILALLVVTACTKNVPAADLIITDANIWTGNENQPRATSMAIRADTILAVGNLEKINKFKVDSTKIIDMSGRFIVPGFIDSHVHLMMGGNALLSVELRDADTKAEFINRIVAYTKTLAPGEWVLEGNWDHTLWGGELPQKEWIDKFTSKNPVVIYRIDGHSVLANSKALSLAGINSKTDDLSQGEIVKNPDGSPTGILKGSAMNLMLNAIPPMTEAKKKDALQVANEYLLSNGVTSVHDVDSLGTFSVAKELFDKGELNIRIYSAKPLNRHDEVEIVDGKWLKTGLLKGFVDGSLGSHTAAFTETYTDREKDFGFFINNKVDLYDWISVADSNNKQITVHAIGDKANNMLLNTYAQVIRENGDKDRRFRVEHAQHLKKNDISRFAELGVIASVQPYHAIDDGRWAEELIGPERIQTTYAFKSLLNAGTILTFGSDWPVAPASPILGIYAATTRRTLDAKNPEGWIPNQKVTVEQALLAYTKNAAYASFEENKKGTLEVGKLADFVILSEDITKIDGPEIKNIKVLQTYIGGKKLFDRKE